VIKRSVYSTHLDFGEFLPLPFRPSLLPSFPSAPLISSPLASFSPEVGPSLRLDGLGNAEAPPAGLGGAGRQTYFGAFGA